MKSFFNSIHINVLRIYRGRYLMWQLIAFMLTFILVTSDTDWKYYLLTRGPLTQKILFPAVIVGFLLPVLVPLFLYTYSEIKKSNTVKTISATLAQSAILGWAVSTFYKIFTGRMGPYFTLQAQAGMLDDISRGFRFGVLRGGAFAGWPSSHTAVAFAMAVSLAALLPKKKLLGIVAILYAFYIGIGVSVNIHWLSDAVAGAIIGSCIGAVVGKTFRQRLDS